MGLNRPWRIDQDNEQGVVVKDDKGNVVHAENYHDIPTERGAAFAEQIIGEARINAYAMVAGVNQLEDYIVAALHQYPLGAH